MRSPSQRSSSSIPAATRRSRDSIRLARAAGSTPVGRSARPAAAAAGEPGDWAADTELAHFPTADFAELTRETERRPLIVLDVRRRSEWEAWHIDGALHIPLHELRGRMTEIPLGEIWVHCQAGYRAAIAASMLAACGRKVVAIDDEFSRSRVAGLAGAGTARG